MYVVAELKPRAETTDTLLHCVSETRSEAEEFILSLFDEKVEDELNWYQQHMPVEAKINLESLYFWCRQKLSGYQIVEVPCIS